MASLSTLSLFLLCGISISLAAIFRWKRKRALSMAVLGIALAAGTGLMLVGVRPPQHQVEVKFRLVYLCVAADADELKAMQRMWPETGQTVVVTRDNAQLKRMVKLHFPSAVLDTPMSTSPLPEGLTVEAAMQDLAQRAPQLKKGSEVHIACPRAERVGEAAQVRGKVQCAFPWLVDAIKVDQPDVFGIQWPQVALLAPAHIGPSLQKFPLAVDVERHGRDVHLELHAYRDVSSASVVTAVVGLAPDGATLLEGVAATSIGALPESATFIGDLAAPLMDHAVTIEARLVNPWGETLAIARSTTTCEVSKIGILQVEGHSTSEASALRRWLDISGLQTEAISLDLNDVNKIRENGRRLSRWGLIVIDDAALSPQEAVLLAHSIKAASGTIKPSVMLVGIGAGDSLPAGWKQLMGAAKASASTKPAAKNAVNMPPRAIAVICDTSGSMHEIAWGKLTKLDISRQVATQLVNGLGQRQADGRLIWPIGANRQVVSIADYTREPTQATGNWEMHHGLIEVYDRVVNRKEPISDVVMIFDPTDYCDAADWTAEDKKKLDAAPFGDCIPMLPLKSAQYASELMSKYNVRFWLISSAGKPPQDAMPSELQKCVKVVLADYPDPQAFGDAVQRMIFEAMFPRIGVEIAAPGLKLLPDTVRSERLQKFVENRAADLRLLTSPTPYAARTAAPDVIMWAKPWREGPEFDNQRSPLLVRGAAEVDGVKLAVYHLRIDPQAESAKTPDHFTPIRDAVTGMLVKVFEACAAHLAEPQIIVTFEGDHMVAYRSDFAPFNLETLKVQGFAVDRRRGDRLLLKPENLSDKPTMISALLVESDKAIGEQRSRIPMVKSPALPVTDAKSLVMLGGTSAGPQTAATPIAVSAGPSVDQRVWLAFLATAWLSLSIVVLRQ